MGHGKFSIFLVALTKFGKPRKKPAIFSSCARLRLGKPRKMFHFPSCAHFVRQTTERYPHFLCLASLPLGGSEKSIGISGTSSLRSEATPDDGLDRFCEGVSTLGWQCHWGA